VNGSLLSDVTVNAGLFGGSGKVGSLTLNGGALSPGNSIGTITITGNLAFTTAAAYIVEVSTTSADLTNVGGTAKLAGTLAIVPVSGAYTIGQQYVLLTAAGGVSGTFNPVDFTGLFNRSIVPVVSYDANDVFLTLAPNTISQFASGLTVNQHNVAKALDTGFLAGHAPAPFLSLFNIADAGLPAAFTALSGEAATGASAAGFRLNDDFLQLMLDPFAGSRGEQNAGTSGPALGFAPERVAQEPDSALAYAKRMVTKDPLLKAPPAPAYEPRWTVWSASYGGQGKFDGDAAVIGSHNVTARDFGFAGGADYRFSPNTVIGAALSGGSISYGLSGLGGGHGDSVLAGLYGSTRQGNAYLSAAVDVARHDLSSSRVVILPGFLDPLSADYSARQIGARMEGGYRYDIWGKAGVTPYAALQAQTFHTPGYGERDGTGAVLFGLNYASETTNETRSEFGLRSDYVLRAAADWSLTLRTRAAWAHEFDGLPSATAQFQGLPAATFTVFGAAPARDAALATLGAELKVGRNISVLGKFDGTFASNASIYSGSGTVRYTW
jgi:outer membrane autotransporter protein